MRVLLRCRPAVAAVSIGVAIGVTAHLWQRAAHASGRMPAAAAAAATATATATTVPANVHPNLAAFLAPAAAATTATARAVGPRSAPPTTAPRPSARPARPAPSTGRAAGSGRGVHPNSVPAPAALPEIEPNYFATSTPAAQVGVDEGRIVLETGPDVGVPTLNGDIDDGYGYWSYLPMGYRFRSLGHVYEVFHRVPLDVHGGVVADSVFGGDLDLHTCTAAGSTVTWARQVG